VYIGRRLSILWTNLQKNLTVDSSKTLVPLSDFTAAHPRISQFEYSATSQIGKVKFSPLQALEALRVVRG
jgi:hypothetical protein